jgi:hypothetical protein
MASDIFSSYERVKSLVCSSALRVIHIDAPPRTISSAFQIALTEGADAHLYEPFRRHGLRQALEATCQDVLALYDKVKEKRSLHDAQNEKPVIVTIKELSQFFRDDDFNGWLPLVSGWVSIIRSPNTQMQSFMTRSILNGNHFSAQQIEDTRQILRVQNEKEPSEYEMVFALSEDFRVKRGKRTAATVVLPHKLETKKFDMWGALSRHFEELRDHDIPTVVVDGTILCTQPERVMRRVAEVLHLSFNPRMLLGWEIASGSKLIPTVPRDTLKEDAWLKDAITTRSLIPPHNQPLPLSMFTPTVRRFTERALEYFMDFANSSHAVLPRIPKDIQTLFSTSVPEGAPFGIDRLARAASTFKEAQPIAAYSVVLSMPTRDEAERAFRDEMLAELNELHHSFYGDSFQIMVYRQRAMDAGRRLTNDVKPN